MATSVKELPLIPKWQLDVPRYWITLSRGRQILQLATKVSKKCHISKKIAHKEILQFLIVIFCSNVEMTAKLAIWLDLITIRETKSSKKIVWNEDELRYLTKEKNMRTTIKRKVNEKKIIISWFDLNI